MEIQNKCYTYFRIVGDFDTDVITAKLGIVEQFILVFFTGGSYGKAKYL